MPVTIAMNDTLQKQFLIHITIDEFKQIVKESLTETIQENISNRDTSSGHPEFMNVTQASEFLGLAVNTLYEKTCKRTIPHLKRGNRLMFKRSELIKWLEEGKIPTQKELYQVVKVGLHKLKR